MATQDYTLIPADEGLSVDERLEAALAGVVPDDDPDVVRPLGRGWVLDRETGELVAHGTSPARVYGLDNLQAWIEKTLITARFAHPIYSDEYGVDEPWQDFGTNITPQLQARIEDKTRAALTVHDRISEVDSFAFEVVEGTGILLVSFRVQVDGDEGDEPMSLELAEIPLGGGV
jgi:hypothetical protein